MKQLFNYIFTVTSTHGLFVNSDPTWLDFICCNIYHIHKIMPADLNLVFLVSSLPRTCALSHGDFGTCLVTKFDLRKRGKSVSAKDSPFKPFFRHLISWTVSNSNSLMERCLLSCSKPQFITATLFKYSVYCSMFITPVTKSKSWQFSLFRWPWTVQYVFSQYFGLTKPNMPVK